jgi:hypothetical protein
MALLLDCLFFYDALWYMTVGVCAWWELLLKCIMQVNFDVFIFMHITKKHKGNTMKYFLEIHNISILV